MSQTNWAHFIAGQAGVVPLSLGMPGTAKTAVHRALAQQSGRRFIPLMLDQLLPEDIGGVPCPRTISINGQNHECVVKLLDEGLVRAFAEPSLVLVDELTNAGHSIQAAALQLINEPPPGCWMFAAANPVPQAANGVELAPPMVNRLCVLEWSWHNDERRAGWRNGFQRYPSPQLPIVTPDFLDVFGPMWGNILCDCEDRFPEMFDESAYPDDPSKASQPWPSPRSWTNVGRLLAAADSVGADAGTRWALVKGCVGPAACDQFQRFVTSLQLPDPEELLAMPHTLKLPPRFDLSRAIVASVIGRVKANCTPIRWEAGYDVLEKVFDQQPETAMASEGTLWKLKPEGHLPKPRNGAAAEMRRIRLGQSA